MVGWSKQPSLFLLLEFRWSSTGELLRGIFLGVRSSRDTLFDVTNSTPRLPCLPFLRVSSMSQRPGQPFSDVYLDPTANALMDGANPQDGGGVGSAFKSTANGSCMLNSASTCAWGGRCHKPRDTNFLALPLRVVVILTGIRRLGRIDDTSYFRKREAYDGEITDTAFDTELTMTEISPDVFTEDVSRALLLLALMTIAGEFKEGSIFCMPLIAEALHVNLRVFLPGENSYS